MDTFAKAITVLVLAICVYLAANYFFRSHHATEIIISGGFMLLFIGSYLFNTNGYEVGNDSITIVRPVGNLRIPFNQITEVKKLGSVGFLRVFGIGGLCGWYGKFWNRETGLVSMYSRNRMNCILLRMDTSRSIILSPDDSCMADRIHTTNRN